MTKERDGVALCGSSITWTALIPAEKQLLHCPQQLVDFHRHRQETIAAQDTGGGKVAVRSKVAQAKERHFREIAVILKLLCDGCCICRGSGQIDHDQVWAEPTRGVNRESGIVFFADGIFTAVSRARRTMCVTRVS
jgi:hypothetical protein